MLPQDAHQVNGFASKNARSTIHNATAFALKTLLEGRCLNGEIDAVPASDKPFITHMNTLDTVGRKTVYDAFKYLYPDPSAVAKAVFAADGIEQDAEADSWTTLADIRERIAGIEWLWPRWIIKGTINCIAAEPGAGKTRLLFDLARRIWHAEPWPDGQPNVTPSRTPTLWIPGDRHYSQILDVASKFGLPDEAVILNSRRSSPFDGLSLDDPAVRSELRTQIKDVKPAFVALDTIGSLTSAKLYSPEESGAFYGPLMDLAIETSTPIIVVTHLSKGKEVLGRRIKEKARVVVMLSRPDPDGEPDRRRLWVDKSFDREPDPLGVTIGENGYEFDHEPPTEPDKGWAAEGSIGTRKVVRNSGRSEKAEEWLKANLAIPARVSALRSKWESEGFRAGTMYRAKDSLGIDEYEDDRKKWWKLPTPTDDEDSPNNSEFDPTF